MVFLLSLLVLLLASFEVQRGLKCALQANSVMTTAIEGNQYNAQLKCLITRIMNVTRMRSMQLRSLIRYNETKSSKM